MHQSWRVAISLSAVMLFAAYCNMHAVGPNVSEDFERSLNLEDGGEAAVANTNGSVQVNVRDGSQVLLRATLTGSGSKSTSPRVASRSRPRFPGASGTRLSPTIWRSLAGRGSRRLR